MKKTVLVTVIAAILSGQALAEDRVVGNGGGSVSTDFTGAHNYVVNTTASSVSYSDADTGTNIQQYFTISENGISSTVQYTAGGVHKSEHTTVDFVGKTELSNEATARKAADNTLTTNIATNEAAIKAEINFRKAGEVKTATDIKQGDTDTLLAAKANTISQVAAETTNRQAADDTITASVTTETAGRKAADDAITASVTTETAERKAADDAITANMTTETAERKSADDAITANMTTETAERKSADDAITASVTTETAERKAADAAFTASMTDSNAQINDNTYAIKANSKQIAKNTKDIVFLKEEIERVDGGMAGLAAMSNLVRPHGVGKINISAAVGGYNNQEAIAVGAGFRATEGLTFQASIAADAGKFDPSWGVGVGYEF